MTLPRDHVSDAGRLRAMMAVLKMLFRDPPEAPEFKLEWALSVQDLVPRFLEALDEFLKDRGL